MKKDHFKQKLLLIFPLSGENIDRNKSIHCDVFRKTCAMEQRCMENGIQNP